MKYTLPQIAEHSGAEYRTLRSWIERGLIKPSVEALKKGTGHVEVFTERDAELIYALAELRRRGLDMDALAIIAATLRTRRTSTCPVCHGALELDELQPTSDRDCGS